MDNIVRPQKPHEMVATGMLGEMSMTDFKPDQRLVERALGAVPLPTTPEQPPMQGGVAHANSARVPNHPAQFGSNGSPVSSWNDPWNKDGET